jgi:hypothetical protein
MRDEEKQRGDNDDPGNVGDRLRVQGLDQRLAGSEELVRRPPTRGSSIRLGTLILMGKIIYCRVFVALLCLRYLVQSSD